MLIHINLRQRTDINPELALRRKRPRQLLIQPVDALQHQHIRLLHLDKIPLVLALARLKIKIRQLHTLSIQKLRHILVQQINIQRLQALKIILPILIPRRIHPVHIVIVETDRMRRQPMRRELDRKPVAERRLAGRGRTRDQHKLHRLFLRDLLRNLRNLLFLQCLRNQHHLLDIPLCDAFIQIRNRRNSHLLAPALRFPLYLEYLRGEIRRRHRLRGFLLRHLQNKTIVI